MKKGLVSCVIPTYKRSDTLPRAINSVLGQTYQNIEVIVVDDNAPESQESLDVKEVLSGYSTHSNVHYISQKKHINGAVARNEGIKASEGEFIAFLDDDEEWLPEKVSLQVEYLNMKSDVDGVSCLYVNYRGGKEVNRIASYSSESLQFKILTCQIMVHTSTFLCRRATLNKSGAFNPRLLRHQDMQMFVDFLNYGRIDPICKYLVINHIDSEINRPNAQRLIYVKNEFFEAVKETMNRYNIKEQQRIHSAHNFEISYIALKQGRYFLALKCIFKAGLSVSKCKDLFKRFQFHKAEIT